MQPCNTGKPFHDPAWTAVLAGHSALRFGHRPALRRMVRALLRKHWIGCWNASRAADQNAESTSIDPFNGTRVVASSPSRQPKKRNIHRPVSGARGFVPRRLSYAYRRPKLFTIAEWQLLVGRDALAASPVPGGKSSRHEACDCRRAWPSSQSKGVAEYWTDVHSKSCPGAKTYGDAGSSISRWLQSSHRAGSIAR